MWKFDYKIVNYFKEKDKVEISKEINDIVVRNLVGKGFERWI